MVRQRSAPQPLEQLAARTRSCRSRCRRRRRSGWPSRRADYNRGRRQRNAPAMAVLRAARATSSRRRSPASGAAGSSTRSRSAPSRSACSCWARSSTVASNLNEVVTRWTQKVQVTFYLEDGLEPRIRESLQRPAAATTPRWSASAAVSREEALRALPRAVPRPAHAARGPRREPVPGLARGRRCAPTTSPPRTCERAGARPSRRRPGVEEVAVRPALDPAPRHRRAPGARAWARSWAAILVLAGVFTISNVIRLTVYARQDELDIMRLVGATPRLREGAVRGGRHDPGRPGRARCPWGCSGSRSACSPATRWRPPTCWAARRSSCPRELMRPRIVAAAAWPVGHRGQPGEPAAVIAAV